VIWNGYSDPLFFLTKTLGYIWIALLFAVIIILALSKPSVLVATVARLGIFCELGSVSLLRLHYSRGGISVCHQIFLHTLPSNSRVVAVTFFAAAIPYAIAKLS
jgi:hypothetical protein